MGDIALIHGNIIPMDGYKRCQAIIALNDKIAAVGSDQEIERLAEKAGVRVLDLKGATVLPGLHDCHAHLSLTGFDAQGINMYDAGDITEVLARLKEADETWEAVSPPAGLRRSSGRRASGPPPRSHRLLSAWPVLR